MRAILFIAIMSGQVMAIGIDINFQKPYSAIGSWPAVSLQLTENSKWQPLYFSSGVVLRPCTHYQTTYNIPTVQESRKTHSFYGLYGGTFIGFAPIFRPGVIFGISWKREEIIGLYNGKEIVTSYSPFQTNPYFGVEIHVLIMSFIVTNEGYGAGINLNMGKR
jgi:hypothetical protein